MFLDLLGNWVIALVNVGIGEYNATDLNIVVIIQIQIPVYLSQLAYLCDCKVKRG